MIKQAEQLKVGDFIQIDKKPLKVESLEFYGNYKNPRIKVNGRKFKSCTPFKLCSEYIGESNLLEKYLNKIKIYSKGSRICPFDDIITPLEESCSGCGKR